MNKNSCNTVINLEISVHVGIGFELATSDSTSGVEYDFESRLAVKANYLFA